MKYRFSIVSAASTLVTQWNLGLQTQSIPEGCSWTELVKDQNNFPSRRYCKLFESIPRTQMFTYLIFRYVISYVKLHS